MPMREAAFRAAAVLAVSMLAACAAIPPGAGQNAADPLEVYNRHMFEFNDRVDRALTRPIAQAYEAVLPQPVRDCIGSAFANLGELPTALNNLLQAKPVEAISDLCRFTINSTVGLLGCFDVAAKMGLLRNSEDFGQTLGRWGLPPGPYFVLPLLGPSTIRDTAGRAVDIGAGDPLTYVDPASTRSSLWAARLIDTRAALFAAEKLVEQAAIDKYQFVRDAYLQRRRNQVYDGNPPRQREEDDADKPADQPAAQPAR